MGRDQLIPAHVGAHSAPIHEAQGRSSACYAVRGIRESSKAGTEALGGAKHSATNRFMRSRVRVWPLVTGIVRHWPELSVIGRWLWGSFTYTFLASWESCGTRWTHKKGAKRCPFFSLIHLRAGYHTTWPRPPSCAPLCNELLPFFFVHSDGVACLSHDVDDAIGL